MTIADKKADLAGPGISTYEEVEKILPTDYESILSPKERMTALYEIKLRSPGGKRPLAEYSP